MLRIILCCIFSFIINTMIFGQVGIGTTTPASSAALDLNSNNKGFLPPRMTWQQIKAIVNPAEGLQVYDISIHALRIYDGKRWITLAPKQESLSDAPGNFSSILADSSNVAIPFSVKIGTDKYIYVLGMYANKFSIGGITLTSSGDYDIFFSKFDTLGNLQWIKSVGSTGQDVGRCLALDNSNNIYIAGYFMNTVDFDPGPGTQNLTSSGSFDGYYAKYDNNGNLLWSKRIGGISQDEVDVVVTDGTNVFIGGTFNGTATFNTTSMTSAGLEDIFLGKYKASDGNLGTGGSWPVRIGGAGSDGIGGLDLYSGGVVISGIFTGSFTIGASTVLTSVGGYDSYIATYNSFGGLSNTFQIGGTQDDIIQRVVPDASGNIYFMGNYTGTCDFDPSPVTTYNLTAVGSNDMFIMKLNNAGVFQWASSYGGTGSETTRGIAIDNTGNIYVSGYYTGPSIFSTYTFTSSGSDAFLLKLNSNGNLQWIQTAGSTSDDYSWSVAVSPDGNLLFLASLIGSSPFVGFNKSKYNSFGFYLARYEE